LCLLELPGRDELNVIVPPVVSGPDLATVAEDDPEVEA
jgi:hypothetical protein